MVMRAFTSVLFLVLWMAGFAAIAMEQEEERTTSRASPLEVNENKDNQTFRGKEALKTCEEYRKIEFMPIADVNATICQKELGRIQVTTTENQDYQLTTPLIPIRGFKKIWVSIELYLKKGSIGIGFLKEDQSLWLTQKIYDTLPDTPSLINDTIIIRSKPLRKSSFITFLNRKLTEENGYLAFTNESYGISEFEIRGVTFKVKTYPPEPERKSWDISESLSSLLPAFNKESLAWIPSFISLGISASAPEETIPTTAPTDHNSLEDDWVIITIETQPSEPFHTTNEGF